VEQLTLPPELTAGLAARAPAPTLYAVRAEIHTLRAQDYGWRTIAARFNATGVPTPSGRGRWYGASVIQVADPNAHAAKMRRYRARQRAALIA